MEINKSELVNARYEKKLTTVEASKKAGIGRATLYRLENGITTKANASTLSKLSTLYERNVTDFLKEGE